MPGRDEEVPAALRRAQAEFGRHLAAERGLSRHTVRAYLGDVRSLLEHARAWYAPPSRGGLHQPVLVTVKNVFRSKARHAACPAGTQPATNS